MCTVVENVIPRAHVSLHSKQAHDRFSRVCTAHPRANTRQTHADTTERTSSVGLGRLCAVHRMRCVPKRFMILPQRSYVEVTAQLV